jgi:hypothetical protein
MLARSASANAAAPQKIERGNFSRAFFINLKYEKDRYSFTNTWRGIHMAMKKTAKKSTAKKTTMKKTTKKAKKK